MIQLNLFEPGIIKFDHLVADTPRQAYYKVWLESLMEKYLVRKESGTKNIPWTNGFGSLTIL